MFEQFMQVGKEWGFPAALLFGLCIAIFIIYRNKAAHERKLEEARQSSDEVAEKLRLEHDQKKEDETMRREAQREERMGARLDAQQEMIQSTLISQLEKSTSAITRIGQAADRMSETSTEVSRTHREIVESNKLVVAHCLGQIPAGR